jgi:hypothetical protein
LVSDDAPEFRYASLRALIPAHLPVLDSGLNSKAPAGVSLGDSNRKNPEVAREQLRLEVCGHSERTHYGAVELR